MCRAPVLFLAALRVGGNWDNTANAGLWNWNTNNAPSDSWINIGARLMFCEKREIMCRAPVLFLAALFVGGNWNNSTNAGLWNWNTNNAPSNTNINIGARLIFWKKKNYYSTLFSLPLGKN